MENVARLSDLQWQYVCLPYPVSIAIFNHHNNEGISVKDRSIDFSFFRSAEGIDFIQGTIPWVHGVCHQV
jgi:hypothetical protein